jgi:hypothetical protein
MSPANKVACFKVCHDCILQMKTGCNYVHTQARDELNYVLVMLYAVHILVSYH